MKVFAVGVNRSQWLGIVGILVMALAGYGAGCTYESSLQGVNCEQEGARSGGRLCQNGHWISEADTDLDGSATDASDVLPDVPPDDAGDADDADANDCPQGQTRCNGTCVDTQTDEDHCGACNQACNTYGQHSLALCQQGSCQRTCEEGWADADQDWHDTDDPENSNGCEIECTPTEDPTEICDGVDNNCDGNIDEGVTTRYYLDADNDTWGLENDHKDLCVEDGDYRATEFGDCDDSAASINPGATESCNGFDDNCDGNTDEGFDEDGDGVTSCDGDCNDNDDTIYAGATETCNGVDDNCDGNTDEGFDADGDGVTTCDGDCNDNDNTVYPGATEVCDGADNNCDGDTDEGVLQTFYADSDGDGYGNDATTAQACSAPPNHVADSSDCNDGDDTINPGASESCNDVDDNCDGNTDEGVLQTFYADTDGDGYGDGSSSTDACSAPADHVSDGTDCDDSDTDINPGATEVCDDVDNNCDGDTDEGVLQTFYADNDGDGYGDSAATIDACSAPTGYVSDDTDCADNDSATHPGASEICDGRDNDCDPNTTDESAGSADSWCDARHSNSYSCIIGGPHNEICCERDGSNTNCDDEVDCTNGVDDDNDGDTDCEDSDCGGMFCNSGPNCQNNVCVTP